MFDWMKKLLRVGVYSKRDHVSQLFEELKQYGIFIKSPDSMAEKLRASDDWKEEFVTLVQTGRWIGIRLTKKLKAPITADILQTILVRNGFNNEQAQTTSYNVSYT